MTAKPKPKAHKLDIFETLAALDRKDYTFLERQPEEDRKGFAPPVVLRWMGAVQGRDADLAMVVTNEIANVNFYDLYEHPELQYRLLAAAGLGTRQRHDWIPFPKQAKTTKGVEAFIARFYPFANHQEITLLVSQFTRETFVEFVDRSGCTPAECKEAIDAFDQKEGTVKKGRRKS